MLPWRYLPLLGSLDTPCTLGLFIEHSLKYKIDVVEAEIQQLYDVQTVIGKKHGVAVWLKAGRTLKNILVSPKDKDEMVKKNSVIYSYCCGEIDCDEEYIGESGRTFGERFKEHLKNPSPIFSHQNTTGHITSMDNFTIIGREENSLARTIQESMFIMVNNPTLNINIGKYNLPHIWDKILFTVPELKLKK